VWKESTNKKREFVENLRIALFKGGLLQTFWRLLAYASEYIVHLSNCFQSFTKRHPPPHVQAEYRGN